MEHVWYNVVKGDHKKGHWSFSRYC